MNPVSARLLNQQLASPIFNDPVDVVGHFGAMQAQEYRMMRWAVAMRTRRPSIKEFAQAYDEGRIIRAHLLRGTWQLVAAGDYHWMFGLCAGKAEKVIRGWMSANHITLPPDEQSKVLDLLVRTTEEKRSATKEDFAQALAKQGMAMDDHRLSYHIRFAELRGVLCSGDLLPMKASYSLVSAKIGPGSTLDRDEALQRLARKYFQSHSPATFEDFLWWSGMGVADCRKGMELLGSGLRSARIGGREFFILESCRTKGFRKRHALLLPPFDEYLVGYKSRDLVIPPEFRERAHNNSGSFYPVVAHDGIICGNWSPFGTGPRCDYFRPGEPVLDEDECFNVYGKAMSRK